MKIVETAQELRACLFAQEAQCAKLVLDTGLTNALAQRMRKAARRWRGRIG